MQITLPIAELRKRKLFLAAPMYGGGSQGLFTRSVMDLSSVCIQNGIQMQTYFLFNESLIPRARNYCCDEFMRSDATHLMFIDADIGFNPQDVLALLALAGEDSPYDIIGGAYPKKCISWEKIKMAVDKGFADEDPGRLETFVGDYVFNPKGNVERIPLHEPVEVLEIGTGFMMIRKSSMKKFVDAYPEYLYRPDHVRTKHFDGSREITQFFQAEIDGLNFGRFYEEKIKKLVADIRADDDFDYGYVAGELEGWIEEAKAEHNKKSKRYLSEDYWFCQKAQAIGMKTWLCPWMKLQHAGTMIFGGSLLDIAALGAAPTADPSQIVKT